MSWVFWISCVLILGLLNYKKKCWIFFGCYTEGLINKAFKENSCFNQPLTHILSLNILPFLWILICMIRVHVLLSFLVFIKYHFFKFLIFFSSIVWGWKEETESDRWAFCHRNNLCWQSQVGLRGIILFQFAKL